MIEPKWVSGDFIPQQLADVLVEENIVGLTESDGKNHLKRVNYQVGIWKRAHIAKPVYPEPTHDNGWQCVDGMIEPIWVSGDFIPQQLADVLVEEIIVGLTESDESDGEFDDVLYSIE
jgi:hypothetical protein